jgi:hypothetical protein
MGKEARHNNRARASLVLVAALWTFPCKLHSLSSPAPVDDVRRRRVLHRMGVGLVVSLVAAPPVGNAGEVGAKITAAVTQSDLGVSVRRSVVRGAQFADKLDGQWEQFSDRFGLGANRSTQPGRPEPKAIPDPKPLDTDLARKLLKVTDDVFCSVTKIPAAALSWKIQKVADTVRPSFVRSGLRLSEGELIETGPQFNFASYVHFKSYSDLLLDQNIDFRIFKPTFETQAGLQVAALLLHDLKPRSMEVRPTTVLPDQRKKSLDEAIETIRQLANAIVAKGLIAQIDLAPLESDDIDDWSQDVADLSWSIALDGDITLQSQILLQEQGLRLYPNYSRYAIQTILGQLPGQKVITEDYYMDTDYDSDPNKFEVKEVLVNISIESI